MSVVMSIKVSVERVPPIWRFLCTRARAHVCVGVCECVGPLMLYILFCNRFGR